jgi:hypothetical protein
VKWRILPAIDGERGGRDATAGQGSAADRRGGASVRARGAKVVLTDIRDELGERAADTYVTRVTDRPSFKKAPADQLAHFAAAEESRSAAG